MVGFRKFRSCLDNLTRLVSYIQTGFSKNLITAACFVDIDNAYNNVDLACLIKVLDSYGVGSRICLYLWAYLKNRRLHVDVDGVDISRTTGRGLAQGDPLSPLLFNIATSNICKKIQNVEILQYADDFVLYKSDKKIGNAAVQLQNACLDLSSLLSNLGLVISPTKSKICIFRKGYSRDTIEFQIDNFSLATVNQVKYLGMWLDGSLRWRKHINETVLKVSKLVNILKVLVGRGWGLHQKHVRRLYISLIRSRLDYGSFLYDNSCKTYLYKLDKVQNQALRVIGGFIRSTPIHTMESELHLPPLQYRRQYLACKFGLKAKTFNNNKTITGVQELSESTHSSYWTNKRRPLLTSIFQSLDSMVLHSCNQLEMYSLQTWVSSIDLLRVVCDSIPSVNKGKHLYKPCDLRNTCVNFVDQRYDRYHKIYTDGSKDGRVGGAAFFDPFNDCGIKIRIDSNISIMHIELIAIAEALSYVQSIKYDKFVILTDSKSSLQHLARCTSHMRGNPIAYQILESILNFQSLSRKIVLQWIPSHVGIGESDIVDQLAKEACWNGIALEVLPLHTDYTRVVKEKCHMCWQEYFDERSREKGIWYRTIQPQVPKYPWIENVELNRKALVTALRLRTGHIASKKFAFLMGKVSSPNCEDCCVTDDILHIIFECVRNRTYREHLGVSRGMNIGLCNSVLANPVSVEARKLYKLVEMCLC
ncbi:unnamed protein product [Arctia plantaginis]|uniref:Uncharacterized protein n=1 Tax=Arctia plantaginis TaxID=874455 RepID=A0A8S1BI61_ARCPL|nr:unnamed protein product [Arctia plantaginis]